MKAGFSNVQFFKMIMWLKFRSFYSLGIVLTFLALFIAVFIQFRSKPSMFRTVSFEVFGRVQGVYFRKHTVDEARRLGLVGNVRNTSAGSVKGIVQGEAIKVEMMKTWLKTTGSPMSHIEKAVFTEEVEIATLQFTTFDIVY